MKLPKHVSHLHTYSYRHLHTYTALIKTGYWVILSRGTNSPVSQVRQTQNTNWIHDLESKPWIWILTYINPFWDFPFTACMENGKTGNTLLIWSHTCAVVVRRTKSFSFVLPVCKDLFWLLILLLITDYWSDYWSLMKFLIFDLVLIWSLIIDCSERWLLFWSLHKDCAIFWPASVSTLGCGTVGGSKFLSDEAITNFLLLSELTDR